MIFQGGVLTHCPPSGSANAHIHCITDTLYFFDFQLTPLKQTTSSFYLFTTVSSLQKMSILTSAETLRSTVTCQWKAQGNVIAIAVGLVDMVQGYSFTDTEATSILMEAFSDI